MSTLKHFILDKKSTLTPLYVEEWGCNIYIKNWSYRDRVEIKNLTQSQSDYLLAYVVIFSCLDENCCPIFSIDDLQKLLDIDSKIIEKLANKAIEINQPSKEEIKKD